MIALVLEIPPFTFVIVKIIQKLTATASVTIYIVKIWEE